MTAITRLFFCTCSTEQQQLQQQQQQQQPKKTKTKKTHLFSGTSICHLTHIDKTCQYTHENTHGEYNRFPHWTLSSASHNYVPTNFRSNHRVWCVEWWKAQLKVANHLSTSANQNVTINILAKNPKCGRRVFHTNYSNTTGQKTGWFQTKPSK